MGERRPWMLAMKPAKAVKDAEQLGQQMLEQKSSSSKCKTRVKVSV
jgi:hypothetical protein